MEKRGQMMYLGFAIVIIITIIAIIFVIKTSPENESDTDTINQDNTNITGQAGGTAQNQSAQINITADTNTTQETNISTNNTTNNQSTNTTTLNDTAIPEPTGSITYIDRRNDDGYYCNGSVNPEHAIRLYTYKLINGTKTLSENYIESKKVTSICDTYGTNYNESVGLNYEIEWIWEGVEEIDGYRAYQYYVSESISRDNYTESIDLSAIATKLLDTRLDLW